jgi:hypothetical protein
MAAKAVDAIGYGLLVGVTGLATGFVGALVGGIEVVDTSGCRPSWGGRSRTPPGRPFSASASASA